MPAADIILRNARVLTMNARQPSAELVAVSGDTISFVGDDDRLDSVRGPDTRVIDCQGSAVVPGFNDAHCHLFSFIRKLLSVDLSPEAVGSIADIKEALRRRAAATPPGTWLSGTGFNEFYLAEKRYPDRRDLDEVTPDHPVVLSHRTLHACVLNSRALELAGISMDTEPPPGAVIEREPETGEPSGVLIEMLGYIREQIMPPLIDAELERGVSLADEIYRSYGITSIQDASPSSDLRRWQQVDGWQQRGKLRSRVYLMPGSEAYQEFREARLGFGGGDDHLRLGAVKLMLTEATGSLDPPQEEVNRLALEAHRAGFQLAFHAVEESAVAAAITAIEYVNEQDTTTGRRHRIEHCSECPPALLERLHALGMVIVIQPPFLYYSGERYLATVDPHQLPWLYRIRTPLQQGVIVAASSDSPIAPNNPMVGVYAAVLRRAASGHELLPEERVSPGQALAMYTANAAYASFEENAKGSILAGRLADIAVLSGDPLSVPPEQIKDIKVVMTLLGGEVVWEA